MTDTTELANVEDWLKQNARVGLEKVDPTDLPIPRLLIVQGMTRGAVLANGKKAAPGSIYYEGTQEATDKFSCVILSAKKGKATATDGSGDQVDAWLLIGATEGDWKPFILTCRSSQINHAGAFVSRLITRGVPPFAVKVVLETKEINGEKGDFYVPVFREEGLRQDTTILEMLKKLAQKYGDYETTPELAVTPVMSDEEKKRVESFAKAPDATDIPF